MRNPLDPARKDTTRTGPLFSRRTQLICAAIAAILALFAFTLGQAAGRVPTAQAAGVSPDTTTWHLVFDDEFNDGYLHNWWATCYPWYNPQSGCSNTGNNELQWYMPGN